MPRCLVVMAMVLVIGACTSDTSRTPVATTSVFVSADTPWSFVSPPGWHVVTDRSPSDPDLMTGVLMTYVTNVKYDFDMERSPGPNSGAGATSALGRSAVVVIIEYLWFPPDKPIHWTTASSTTEVRHPGDWHDDAQNPGWLFRERRVCLGDQCVRALEWHGPDATPEAIALGQGITESIRLAGTWTDGAAS